MEVLMDTQDLTLYNDHHWVLSPSGYLVTNIELPEATVEVNLHNQVAYRVFGNLRNHRVVHINGNKLDNRRCNLSLVPLT